MFAIDQILATARRLFMRNWCGNGKIDEDSPAADPEPVPSSAAYEIQYSG